MAAQSQRPTEAVRPRARPLLRTVSLATGLLMAMLVAACGSSGAANPQGASSAGNGSTGTAKGGVTVAYSRCMRAHGLPSFPDPNSQGAIELQASNGSGPSSINPNSPTYTAAQKACQKLVLGGTTTADQSHELAQALKFSACMRLHGVASFPDPTVSDGQITFAGADGAGRSPNFQTAQSKCSSLLTGDGGS